MSFYSWLHSLRAALETGRIGINLGRRRAGARPPQIERLDDRIAPAFLAPVEYAAGVYPYSMVAADFNNDAVLDLAVANASDFTATVLLGNGDGAFQPAPYPAPATGASPWSIAVGDFDQDGNLDLATANGEDVSVLMGDGAGQFGAPTSIDSTGYAVSVAVGDFNGDGLMDLGVVTGYYSAGYYAFASIHAGDDTGHFAPPKTTFLGYGDFRSATTVDLDGDGVDDLATANALNSHSEGAAGLLRGDESGYFQPPTLVFTEDLSTYDVAVGDVNGDNVADVVTGNSFYSVGISVLLGNSQGGYGPAVTYASGTWPSDVVLGDFTGDGRIDIAYSSSFGVNVLRGNGDGTFSTLFEFPAGGSGWAVAAGDFNGDGWLDIASTNLGADAVSVLINDQFWSAPPPPAPPAVSIADASVMEGNTGAASATFTLTLTKAAAVDVTVSYATADISAAAGSDYAAASTTVTIPAGQTSATFTVAAIGDRLIEPTETFAVNLSAATNATIGDSQGIGTIFDDEPRISISDVTRKEGNGKKSTLFTFTVTLLAAYDEPVTVSYQTVNGTATPSNNDYIAKTGTLTFAPGETTKTITITVKGDSKREANETFYLDLFRLSSNALFTKNRGLGTILNDD